jgi:hypothetical protein
MNDEYSIIRLERGEPEIRHLRVFRPSDLYMYFQVECDRSAEYSSFDDMVYLRFASFSNHILDYLSMSADCFDIVLMDQRLEITRCILEDMRKQFKTAIDIEVNWVKEGF